MMVRLESFWNKYCNYIFYGTGSVALIVVFWKLVTQ